jgi:AAA family ATP:ADP antiporter
VDPVLIYQAKAWIDMFGYRTFKVVGSVLILLMTQWLPVTMNVNELSWFTIVICSLWVMFVMFLRQEYKVIYQKTQ